jgi:hypothetical protein
MRKILFVALLFVLCTTPAAAQFDLVTGQVVDPNGTPYSGATVRAQLAIAGAVVNGQPTVTNPSQAQCISAGLGNAPCQMPFQGTNSFTLDANGNIPNGGISLANNPTVTPAGTQWLFSVTISPGVAPPLGTGPQSFSVAITINTNPQAIGATLSAAAPKLANISAGSSFPVTTGVTVNSGGSITVNPGGSIAPAGGSITATALTAPGFAASAPNTQAPVVTPQQMLATTTNGGYGVLMNAHWVPDASSTNTLGTYSCPNGDCNFTTTGAAAIGQICFGFDTTSGVAFESNNYISASQGTITAVSAQSITCTNTASATITAGVELWWGGSTSGVDDTTALANAIAAAACGTIEFPGGYALISGALFNTTPSNCQVNSTSFQGPEVKGQGVSETYLIPTQNFNWASCTGPENQQCFGAGSDVEIRDFSIWAGGMTTGSGTHVILEAGSYARIVNFDLIGMAGSSATITGIYFGKPSTPSYGVGDLYFQSGSAWGGQTSCAFGATNQTAFGSGCRGTATGFKYVIEPGASVNDMNGFYSSANVQGIGNFYQTNISGLNGATAVSFVNATGGAVANFLNDTVIGNSGGSTSAALSCGAASGTNTFTFQNSFFTGGSAQYTMFGSPGCLFVDNGGNGYSSPGTGFWNGIGTWVIGYPGGGFLGVCTGAVTASATLGFYGTGPNATTTACTGVVIGSGIIASHAGTIQALNVTSASGTSTGDVFTVTVNGVNSTSTCTMTAQTCLDSSHHATVAQGNLISVKDATALGSTETNLNVTVILQ